MVTYSYFLAKLYRTKLLCHKLWDTETERIQQDCSGGEITREWLRWNLVGSGKKSGNDNDIYMKCLLDCVGDVIPCLLDHAMNCDSNSQPLVPGVYLAPNCLNCLCILPVQ